MATRRKRERKRASARKRVQEHRPGGGSNYLRLPDGMDLFEPKAGSFRLDFFCYVVKEKKRYVEAGDLYHETTFWIHRGVGPNNEWHLCAAKTLKQPCPVCEHRAKLMVNPDVDEDVVKEMGPKERQLFLVRDVANDSKVMLWEVSYHLFGKDLDAKIRNADEEDEDDWNAFADPETGLTLRVAFEQSDRGKWVEVSDLEFKPRKKQYKGEVCDEMPCLDELLVPTPYDDLKRLYLQVEDGDKDDDDDDGPSAAEKGIEKGSTVEHDEHGTCEVVHVSSDGSSLRLKDDDGDVHRAVSPDDCEVVEEKYETTVKDNRKPKSKPKPKKPKPKPKPKEEDEDDWDDDDDGKEDGVSEDKDGVSDDKDDDDDDWDDWDDDDD